MASYRESRIPFRVDGSKYALGKIQIASSAAQEYAFDAHHCTWRQSEFSQCGVWMAAFRTDDDTRKFLGANGTSLFFEACDVGVIEFFQQLGFSFVGLSRNRPAPLRL
jgi:hypothetical protein